VASTATLCVSKNSAVKSTKLDASRFVVLPASVLDVKWAEMQNMWTGRIDLNLLECSRTRWEHIRVECIRQKFMSTAQ
jgi:ActR/RegA family two-component response regulator